MRTEARIRPELREVYSQFPGFQLEENLEWSRGLVSAAPLKRSEDVNTTSRKIPGVGGEILVKIYEPAGRTGDLLPAMLWIHGGGYVLGHPDMDDELCERFVQAAECIVVSVDYRLAPEHPYPAAIEDCYAGLVWMTTEAAELLGIDVNRVAIAGASGGGGLTAALALMARDKGGPSIIFQMPLYPMLDNRNIMPSSHEITEEGAVWNRKDNLAAWNMYLGEENDVSAESPYAVPSRADNLAGLPPTYTCVGQLDLFRDETIEYVTRLAQAAVDVEFHLYPGCFHLFEIFVPETEVSQRAIHGYMDAMARALHP
ncbi:alpha/beta hydrolase [Paenibacillus sp. NPDC056933]|uniref:alpha/beta hydrolase n=1 Tax=Paenibacillus sp. NPDC056933 TaxID=3345968 RepID=UPI00363BCA40